jgi:hypothetical protein
MMATFSVSKRYAVVVGAVAGLALALAFVLPADNEGGMTVSRSHANLIQAPGLPEPENFDTAVPSTIQAATYKEVAVGKTQTGARYRIFTGRREGKGLAEGSTVLSANSACFGLRTPKVIGMSCNFDLTKGLDLQAMETTFRGHTMVSGLVSSDVARVVITGAAARDVSVPIRNGTFFFDSARGDTIHAYSRDGRLLASYELAKE